MKKIDNELFHYTEAYLLDPQHPVTVTLIGCGGTGSQMLNNLARVHMALLSLGHPGIHLTAWDNDEVTEANLGRQLFSPAELGMNKAVALITRVNRFFGLQWEAKPEIFTVGMNVHFLSNILITAVDKVAIRKEIGKLFNSGKNCTLHMPQQKNFYWMDLGNSKSSGQIILGTRGIIPSPKKVKNAVCSLQVVTQMFPDLQKYEDKDDTPSCSLAEALTKQDLFINSILAQYGADLIWKMFQEAKINYQGIYVNLKNNTTNPIKVKG